MIRLEVETYCYDCPDFEASVEKIEHRDFFGNDKADTTITCEHRRKCKQLMAELKKSSK